MVLQNGPIIRSPFGSVPLPNTAQGDQLRDQFYFDLLSLFSKSLSTKEQLLWVPETGETTTCVDRTGQARTITYDATVVSRYQRLGSMWQLDFDGSAHEADTPDVAEFTFGNGAVDRPFTVIVLCTPDVNNAAMSLVAKENSATAEEWNFRLNASGHPVLTLTDESASATLTGTYAVAAGTAATLLAASYDGSGAATGIQIFVNGAGVTTAKGGAGSYVAMENTAARIHFFSRYLTKAEFFNGRGAFALILGRGLTGSEHWNVKELVNSVYDLNL